MYRWPAILFLAACSLAAVASGAEKNAQDRPAAVGQEPASKGGEVQELISAVREGETEARGAAMAKLAALGQRAEPAVPVLLECLDDPDAAVRVSAAKALGQLALQPETVIPALIDLFDDTAATPELPVCYLAAQAAAGFGEAVLPNLANNLRQGPPQVQRSTAVTICELGTKAKSILPELIEAIPAVDIDTRRPFLMSALLCLAPEAQPALPLLLKSLDDEDFHMQYWACRVLGRLGPDAKPAIPKLIELAENGVTSVRRNAATALGNIGPAIGEPGVKVLTKGVNDASQVVREDSVIALGKLGALAKPAVPVIEEALSEKSTLASRSQAAKSLWRLDPQSPTPRRVLITQLQGVNEPWAAAEVLGEIGPEIGAIGEVTQLLSSPKNETRLYAAMALGLMGNKAASAAEALQPLLEDPDEEVRQVARQAWQEVRKIEDQR